MNKSKSTDISNTLSRIIYLIVGVLLAFIVMNAVFKSVSAEAAYLVPGILIFLAVLCAAYVLLSKFENVIEKYFKYIIIGFAAVMLISNITLGIMQRFSPTWDFAAVYHSAVQWHNTGTFTDWYDYHMYITNNIGEMAVLKVLFDVVGFFGVDDCFAAAVVFCAVLLTAAMSLTAIVAKMQYGARFGGFAIVMWLLTPTMYFAAAFFYTETMSLPFIIFGYFFFLTAGKADTKRSKLIYYLLMGFSFGLGGVIKMTALIPLIAIIIALLIGKNPKRAAVCAASAGAFFMAITLLINGVIYTYHLDKEVAKEQNMPLTHWVMMGLKGFGGYDPDDFTFTRSFDTHEEAAEAVKKEIYARLDKLGYKGVAELITNKTRLDYSDGGHDLTGYSVDGPFNHPVLYKWLNPKGELHSKYEYCANDIMLAAYILAMVAAFCLALGRNKEGRRLTEYLPPFLALLGQWMFLMMWEGANRYTFNHITMLYLCAVFGIAFFKSGIFALPGRLQNK